MTDVGAIILAAGRGRRLKRGPKAFVRLAEGDTLLERACATLRGGGVRRLVAVLPPGPDPAPLPPRVRIVRNPDSGSGPLESARLGLAALGEVAVVLLYPVDHPDVEDRDVAALVEAARHVDSETARVVPVHAGRSGHPVAVVGPGLGALRAKGGSHLREVLRAAGSTVHVPVGGPGILRNVNTERDLHE